MAKIQAVWAIDIGQAALKALKLVPGESNDQVVAEAFDFIEYPKILSQPDAEPDSLVREALETFMDRNDLKGCKVAIAVPGQAGLVKFIKLPPVEKKRIPDIVKFEARQQIPFALEEVIWSYQQIGGDDEDADEDFMMAEVGLFAMKRDQINRAILPLRVAGIEVDVVQMAPIALYNYVTFDLIKGNNVDGSVVLIDIGADNTDLIITDGVRIWQRNVPIGGNHFTRALTKELKQTFAKAEHLKRNATKAPDPRAIFTAMRGVFNDFSAEINRSIGFYSSVNRTAKITKVIGLGNGFKLPGLQKFLQQNLTHEVEKVEAFPRLVGDDVKNAPQFQENLASFAVAYGLALQGLGKSALRTNLLPPEIEKVRMIRRKKPWVLAASALMMLGCAALFLGEYKVLAKVDTTAFKLATEAAKSTSKNGSDYKAAFETAKTEWNSKFEEGKSLIVDDTERAKWPQFLKILNAYIYNPLLDPSIKPKLDPAKTADRPKLQALTVHIDAIKPVWREDLNTGWFALLDPDFKKFMHPLDREKAPEGAGWVVQVTGHYYNPNPSAEDRKAGVTWKLGPYDFMVKKIMPPLLSPELRQFGVHHVDPAWMTIEKGWTTEAGASTNNLASGVPILARASAPASAEGGAAGGMEGMIGMMGGAGGPGGSGSGSGAGGGRGRAMGGEGMMMGGPGMGGAGMAGAGGMMGGGPGMGGDATKKAQTTLTRTNFLIQFAWQPPTTAAPPKAMDEIRKELLEAEKVKGSVTTPTEDELDKASQQASQKFVNDFLKSVKATVPAAEGAAPVDVPSAPVGEPKK